MAEPTIVVVRSSDREACFPSPSRYTVSLQTEIITRGVTLLDATLPTRFEVRGKGAYDFVVAEGLRVREDGAPMTVRVGTLDFAFHFPQTLVRLRQSDVGACVYESDVPHGYLAGDTVLVTGVGHVVVADVISTTAFVCASARQCIGRAPERSLECTPPQFDACTQESCSGECAPTCIYAYTPPARTPRAYADLFNTRWQRYLSSHYVCVTARMCALDLPNCGEALVVRLHAGSKLTSRCGALRLSLLAPAEFGEFISTEFVAAVEWRRPQSEQCCPSVGVNTLLELPSGSACPTATATALRIIAGPCAFQCTGNGNCAVGRVEWCGGSGAFQWVGESPLGHGFAAHFGTAGRAESAPWAVRRRVVVPSIDDPQAVAQTLAVALNPPTLRLDQVLVYETAQGERSAPVPKGAYSPDAAIAVLQNALGESATVCFNQENRMVIAGDDVFFRVDLTRAENAWLSVFGFRSPCGGFDDDHEERVQEQEQEVENAETCTSRVVARVPFPSTPLHGAYTVRICETGKVVVHRDDAVALHGTLCRTGDATTFVARGPTYITAGMLVQLSASPHTIHRVEAVRVCPFQTECGVFDADSNAESNAESNAAVVTHIDLSGFALGSECAEQCALRPLAQPFSIFGNRDNRAGFTRNHVAAAHHTADKPIRRSLPRTVLLRIGGLNGAVRGTVTNVAAVAAIQVNGDAHPCGVCAHPRIVCASHSATPCVLRELSIELVDVDGAELNFYGADHTLTLRF